MATEKFSFDSYEQAKSFSDKLYSSDAYEGGSPYIDGWNQVEIDTDKVKDAQAIGVFAGARGGKSIDT